jgi:hypothetical protein
MAVPPRTTLAAQSPMHNPNNDDGGYGIHGSTFRAKNDQHSHTHSHPVHYGATHGQGMAELSESHSRPVSHPGRDQEIISLTDSVDTPPTYLSDH